MKQLKKDIEEGPDSFAKSAHMFTMQEIMKEFMKKEVAHHDIQGVGIIEYFADALQKHGGEIKIKRLSLEDVVNAMKTRKSELEEFTKSMDT